MPTSCTVRDGEGNRMGNSDDDDFVWLPNAWTIEHRRNRREVELTDTWQQHNAPYSQAIGGHTGWLDHMKKGGWAMEDWIVQDLFLPGHIGLLVGDAGTGKSLVALDLMISIISGSRWMNNFECLTSPVVYLAGEGKLDENTKHILGLLLGRGVDVRQFLHRYGSRIQLHAPDAKNMSATAPLSSDAWWQNIEALVTSTHPKEARPKLWILDPLLALINSPDKADDVRPFIARCRWLSEETGGYVLTVHHNNKGTQGQSSRAQKIRGESMLRNLFDDVLILEQDSEDARLAHMYANKLKRGQADDTKPMGHILRAFNDIDERTFYDVLDATGVTRTGEESPKSVKQIVLRYLTYSPELHKATDACDEKSSPTADVEAPRAQVVEAVNAVMERMIDKSGWDQDTHRVWDAISASDHPLTLGGIQQACTNEQGTPSVHKVQARLDVLDSQGLIARVSTAGGVGRPGTAYTLKSRV